MATDLRPMSLGELLDRAFTVYRNNFLLFVGIVAVPQLFVLAVTVGASGMATAGSVGFSIGFLLLLYPVLLLSYAFSYAATVVAVSEVYLGRTTSIRQAYARVRGKIGRMVLLLIMMWLATMGGFILLIYPGVWIMLRTSVAVPSAMLEDLPARAALTRSIALTKGFTGRVVAILLLAVILAWVAALVFEFPFEFLGRAAAQGGVPLFWLGILAQIGNFIASVLVGPLGTIAFALFYYDLRVRKEAFDLQLMMASLEPVGGTSSASPA